MCVCVCVGYGKCGDQIAMGKMNSGGPMFCEWKSDISKQSLGVCEF